MERVGGAAILAPTRDAGSAALLMDAMELEEWVGRCETLAGAVRDAARAALRDDHLEQRTRAVRSGVGDVTYGLDERCEAAVEAWFEAAARERPLSVLTEDTGWLHRGPGPRGALAPSVELADFDHGGTLSELLMLGNIATQFPGETLTYDPASGQITHHELANEQQGYPYRPGWRL